MRPSYATPVLCLVALGSVLCFYAASLNVQQNLSPQGCRMSWMSPSYILQTDFDSSWTRLAHRYSLWLYREVGWESNDVHGRQPVLFIPGNAGSSHQVRSIASSAVRQFYSSPRAESSEFRTRLLKPIDTFTVEFNEDLTAFHGPTMDAQIQFTSDAITFILSRYPAGTTIIVLGHSMGGIVATSLLPSDDIAAIITMSTPHKLPPARFDARIDRIYDRNQRVLENDPTPIMSLCGGATDMMIPSESCILEPRDKPYRRTVFSSALEGAWTGVGHREMVWCHQVRWRVARAILELQDASIDKSVVLDRWLRDGSRLPTLEQSNAPAVSLWLNESKFLPANTRLELDRPNGQATYLLPIGDLSQHFTLYVSKGAISSVSPHKPLALEVSVLSCGAGDTKDNVHCAPLPPKIVRLVPNPDPEKVFPAPGEGSDESEGVVLYEADLSSLHSSYNQWIAVRLDRADAVGWIVGDVAPPTTVRSDTTNMGLLFGKALVGLNPDLLHTSVTFPNLLQHALIVYRIIPHLKETCKAARLPPLLVHQSGSSEVHYFSLLSQAAQLLVHSHSTGPFVDPGMSNTGLRFDVLSSGCSPSALGLQIAWIPTFGRWATRYFTSIVCWAIGIVAIVLFDLWTTCEAGTATIPPVSQSLHYFHRKRLPILLVASFLLSLVPLPPDYYLGNAGNPWLSPVAPILLVISTGLVTFSAFLLTTLLYPLKLIFRRTSDKIHRDAMTRGTLVSAIFILIAVFLLIPWQVAFLGCWVVHLMTCATTCQHMGEVSMQPSSTSNAIPLLALEDETRPSTQNATDGSSEISQQSFDDYNCNFHILLFMTWLLPLSAPVLVVWVRTLVTAGLTTPFDGDHFVLSVAPFLILVEFASRTNSVFLFRRHSLEKMVSMRWTFLIIAAVAVLYGSRKAYMVFDVAKIVLGIIVMCRVIPRYFIPTEALVS